MLIGYRKFSKVTESIYIGNIEAAQDLAMLRREGITHIVAAAAHAQCFHRNHFTYLQFDVQDMPCENIKKHLSNAVKFVDLAVERGGKVFIHWFAGISRSSSTAIAYFMYSQHMTFQQAWDFLKARHPPAYPNAGFQQQLRLYERELGLS